MSTSETPASAGASGGVSVAKRSDSISAHSDNSQTAADFLRTQMRLEAEAREALPYSIDTCTYSRGPLRQNIFSCLTCNPPPADPSEPYESAAGICYACSVQCHGEHRLVEIFSKHNFTCDCGTTRMPGKSPCNIRVNSKTGKKGAMGDEASTENLYNHNFRNLFCCCKQEYDPFAQNGTMFQCLGLGSHLDGGCGEDWYHPGCLMGLGPDWNEQDKTEKEADKNKVVEKTAESADSAAAPPAADEEEEEADEDPPLPPGFPEEESFISLICFKCVEAHPWIKKYAGQPGFLPPVFNTPTKDKIEEEKPLSKVADAAEKFTEAPVDLPIHSESKKRKADSLDLSDTPLTDTKKRTKPTEATPSVPPSSSTTCRLPTTAPPSTPFSLFLLEDFRSHLCPCPPCTTLHTPFPPLLADEEVYEPSLSSSSSAAGAGQSIAGSGSLYERGESALKNMDRVKAIEGVMAYNMMKEKLTPFFQQFAESGQAISADDIKDYFAKLRGDEDGMRAAREAAAGEKLGGDGRKEQEGQ